VEGLPLPDFLTHTLGNVLKVTFFLEEEVKKRKDLITLRMPQPLPPDEALKIILGLLEKNRLSAQEKESALYIAQIPAGTSVGGAVGFGRVIRGESDHVNQFVTLQYTRIQEMNRLLTTLYKGLVKLNLYPEKNAIVLSGSPEKVKTAIQFIEALDIPLIQGRLPLLLSLTYWDTDAFILELTAVLEGMGFPVAKTPKDPGVWFVPLATFNRILALAPDKRAARYIQDWTKELDRPNAGDTAEKTFTYSPKFSKASNLVEVIQKVYGSGTKVVSQSQVALGNTGMGAGPAAQMGRQKGAQGGRQRSALESSLPLDSETRMAADDLRNLVIVVTTPARYEKLREFLQKLDVPSRQVLIEVTLAELTLDDQFQFGLEWALRNVNFLDGVLNLGTLGGLGLSTTQGLTGGFVTDSQKFEAVLNAFASNNKLKLLSSPRLTVMDNQEANIQIGDEVPIITSEVSATDIGTALPTVNRNVQMRQTGVLLRIKPTINTEGLLTLDISQEVSDAKATTTSDIDSPTIFSRRIKTSVVIGHGKSIFLGGLISETKDTTVTKVPFLGDIPWLGELFKSRANRTRKTELIILITPRILTNVDEAVLATQEMQESLEWYKDPLPIMDSGK
jgi:general secretion pathway protein D